MKVFQNVKSTAEYVPYIEVNKDTVYVRSDIEKVEEIEFSGWKYNEIQYSTREYIENLTTSQDTESIALLISMLMGELDFVKMRVAALEGGVE